MQIKKHHFHFIGVFLAMSVGLGGAIIGFAKLSFYIGFTGSCTLFYGITSFYALTRYKTSQGLDKAAAEKLEMSVTKKIMNCTAILAFLHFSLAIVVMFFHKESPREYNLFVIIFFGASALVNIVLALISVIKAIRTKSIIVHHIQFIDIASTFVSLALTQRAILYFAGYEHAELVSFIGGLCFSFFAFLMCLPMYFKIKKKSRD